MYSLRALIGKAGAVERLTMHFPRSHRVALPQSFWLVPLTEALLEDMNAARSLTAHASVYPDLELVSSAVNGWAGEASIAGALAYVEAEFFGGHGDQAAIAWDAGSVALGPVTSSSQAPHPGAINRVLRHLGAITNAHDDEFDTLHLGRCRETERWLRFQSVT